jgi:hypothetical protein
VFRYRFRPLSPSPLRILFLLAALFSLAAAFAACGGDDGGGSDEDPQQVLDRTFSEESDIESADLDASLEIDIAGDGGGQFTANLSGPIDGSGEGTPTFDLTADISGEGGGDSIDFEGGAISTGDAGYISYEGTAYELDSQTFGLVEQIFESASQQQDDEQTGDVPDVRSFLTEVTNEGTEDVEGTETVHVSGAVDIEKLVDTLLPFAERANELGGLGATAQIPTPAELDQLKELVKSATFDVYSGTDDDLLRRFVIDLELQEPRGEGSATIGLDITLGDVNESQEVEAPADAEPLANLLSELGVDLGGLGALGGLDGGGGGGGGAAPGPTSDSLECLQQAETQAEIQKCLQ